MKDPRWLGFEEAVRQALIRHGLADPSDALRVLLWLLRERHRAAITARAARAYREDFELPDPRAATVAESIEDLATNWASAYRHATRVERPCNDLRTARSGESIISAMEAIANVLHELIPLWDFEAMDHAAASACLTAGQRDNCHRQARIQYRPG
jgi:hypothetical protein